MLTVLLLVALRLGLGCHFLYEGVWKIKHRDEFTAEPFLTQAKGPLAGMFYAMIPDIDGRTRLHADLNVEPGKDKPLEDRWDAIRQKFVDAHDPGKNADAKAKSDFDALQEGREKGL